MSSIKRWFTRDTTGTSYNWTGMTWTRQVRRDILRLHGENRAVANDFLQEFRSILRQRAQRDITRNEVRNQILSLRAKIVDFEQNSLRVGGGSNFDAEAARLARIKEVVDNPDNYVFHSTDPGNAAKIERQGMNSGGMTSLDRANQIYTGTDGAKGGSEIIALRKEDLLPAQVSAIEKSPLGEIGTFGAEGFWAKAHVRFNRDELAAAQAAAKDPASALAKADRLASKAEYDSAKDVIKSLEKRVEALPANDNNEINAFMTRLYNDYNRRYLAPTGNYQVDEATGLVDWNDPLLRPGRATGKYAYNKDGHLIYIPEEVQTELSKEGVKIADLSPEEFAQIAFQPISNPQGWNAPLSILDMHSAATASHKVYAAIASHQLSENLRAGAWGLLRMWKMDKVFRPSTAFVATFDELFRMNPQTFGMRGFFHWMEDKVRSFVEHIQTVSTVKQGLDQGMGWWNSLTDTSRVTPPLKRWVERRQKLLESVPVELKARNRAFYEHFGDGFVTVHPTDSGYLAAAERFSSQALGDSGFRAALKGEDAFNIWWDSEEALGIKNATIIGPDGTRIPADLAKEEVYNGYRNFLDKVFLRGARKNGRVEKGLEEWARAAVAIDAEGGTATRVTLPKWLLKDIGPVTGVKDAAVGGGTITKGYNKMMDMLFLNPAQYREQLLSTEVRAYEEARLRTLYQSQGIQILPDDVFESAVGGAYTITRDTQNFGQIAKIASEYKVVPESWVRTLAENKAVEEAEHIMYSWHKTSRIGRSMGGQAAVPFGGPWADMWGWYGREMVMPMVSRGALGRGNHLLAKMFDGVNNYLPNLRRMATVSMMASTDFHRPGGFVGEGWGADFGPLFFLPTDGENSLMTLIPGFGAVPMMLMDTVISALHDPTEDPQGYINAVNEVAKYIPSASFAQQGVARLIGGGTVAAALKYGTDITAVLGGGYYTPVSNAIGDISAEIQATRAIRALFADPQNWADLIEAANVGDFESTYASLVQEAYKKSGTAHAANTVFRQLLPARGQFDTANDELAQVWVKAAQDNPSIAPEGLGQVNMNDPHAVAEAVDNIRNKFWDLPQADRDRLVIQNPSLAVNMVGGWQWSKKAHEQLPNQTKTPYTSSGTEEGLAQHQAYIKQGYIEPLAPGQIGFYVLGTYYAARDRLAKSVYTSVVDDRNQYIWDNFMPDAAKQWFDGLAQDPSVSKWVNNGQELWNNWNSYRDVLEDSWLKQDGIDPKTATDDQRKAHSLPVPEEAQAWSDQWRGLNDENFAQRFTDLPIESLSAQQAHDLNLLGAGLIEPTPTERAYGSGTNATLTGQQLVNVIQNVLHTDISQTPAKNVSSSAYGDYLKSRSTAPDTGMSNLNAITTDEHYTPAFRQQVTDFLQVVDQNIQIRNQLGRIPPDRINMTRDLYNQLRLQGANTGAWYDEVWNDAFRKNYGPVDWQPPKPPDNPRDFVPVTQVRYVLDGDTVVVETQGSNQYAKIRLLGVDAAEMSMPKGPEQRDRLQNAIMETVRNGGRVQFAFASDQTGGRKTDAYGRYLAYLYLDGKPFYFPNEVTP